MAFCTNCGAKLHDGALFCTNCGTKINIQKTVVVPEPEEVVRQALMEEEARAGKEAAAQEAEEKETPPAEPAAAQSEPAMTQPQPAPAETQSEPAMTQPQPAPVETRPEPAMTQPQPAPVETRPEPAMTQSQPELAETRPEPAMTQPQPAPAAVQPKPAAAPRPEPAIPTEPRQQAEMRPEPAAVHREEAVQQELIQRETGLALPPENRPITTLGYIGIFLLMCLPVINLILLIIWACGGCRKVNKKNFARAVLILWGIGLLIAVVVLAVGFLVLGADAMFDLWDMIIEAVQSLQW